MTYRDLRSGYGGVSKVGSLGWSNQMYAKKIGCDCFCGLCPSGNSCACGQCSTIVAELGFEANLPRYRDEWLREARQAVQDF